jgi:phosphoglycerate dehydrogenase-like enzyme
MPVAPDRPHQHRDLPGSSSVLTVRSATPGLVAVEPIQNPSFVAAVTAGGGTVSPLSNETRGLVWLSEKRADELSEILLTHPAIEWVQLPWAGVDGFRDLFAGLDHDTAPIFTSAKGSYSEPVAEHALALILALQREIPSKSRDAHWQTERTGLSLYGNHVVVVGAGGITAELIRLLAPFRASVTVVRRTAEPFAGADRTVTSAELDSVLPSADVVVLAAASTLETRHIIGRAQLDVMPAHAVLVNIARGALLDQDALVAALRDDRLWGVGLDVSEPEPLPADHPLWQETRCVITSHAADTPLMTAHLLGSRIETNVRAFLSGHAFLGLVDTRAGY